MLPSFYYPGVDVTGWWIGEKFDGVRTMWNPQVEALFTKKGGQLRIPPGIQDVMPDVFLDGETWFGRQHFNSSIRIIHSLDMQDIEWNLFRLVAFDSPQPGTQDDAGYENRYGDLMNGVDLDHTIVLLEPFLKCKGPSHAKEYTKQLWDSGAEGSILREPKSLYTPGRTRSIMKLKVCTRSREGKLIHVIGSP